MARVHRGAACLLLAVLATSLAAAERTLDFGNLSEGQTPPGFRSIVAGKGKPGEWKIFMDDVPPLLAPLTTNVPVATKRAVLAQLSQDPTDEHFPMLIFDSETFDDFSLTTRIKAVRGVMEQMAGIVFRYQNESNFYVVRASSLGNTFRFYKVVNGERGMIIGPETPISGGVWHELGIECKGNEIRCSLDGHQLIPTITDSSFVSGRVGFWTKSDSVSYFTDTRITYNKREIPAQKIVRDTLKVYPSLLGLQIYVPANDPDTTKLAASKDEKEVGQPGGKDELDVIKRSVKYFSRGKSSVTITRPLVDRNGEAIAAVRITMKTFRGQTEENALVRTLPIIRDMQAQVASMDDLVE